MADPPRIELVTSPFGSVSLGAVLKRELTSGEWTHFHAVVAFLKQSGLRHLAGPLHTFASGFGASTISVGIDHDGTSLEGLQDLWRLLDGRSTLYVFKEGQGSFARTFHPKAGVFYNDRKALVLTGSGNWTQGGLYSNHEATLQVALDLEDAASADFLASFRAGLDIWQSPGPACRALDAALIRDLYAQGELLSEAVIAQGARAARAATRRSTNARAAGRTSLFGSSGIKVLPPSPEPMPPLPPAIVVPPPLPPAVVVPPPKPPTPAVAPTTPPATPAATSPGIHTAFLIEVRPHKNGEIFLSKLAATADPGFFGMPFTGWTTPARAGNAPYPEASPDPQVEIVIFDVAGNEVKRVRHSLNMVYYINKSEIRVTIPPRLIGLIPEMSILVMSRNPSADLDFELAFYPPTCSASQATAARKNLTVTLPSGGSSRGRQYGWM